MFATIVEQRRRRPSTHSTKLVQPLCMVMAPGCALVLVRLLWTSDSTFPSFSRNSSMAILTADVAERNPRTFHARRTSHETDIQYRGLHPLKSHRGSRHCHFPKLNCLTTVAAELPSDLASDAHVEKCRVFNFCVPGLCGKIQVSHVWCQRRGRFGEDRLCW